MSENPHIIEIYAPKYEGERFEAHRFPLDLIEDLYVLREMTIEMAKQIYLEKNKDRQRIPKNFTRDISFELEGISPGSTIPKIILVTGLTGMFPQANHAYFEEAPIRIIKAIEVAHTGGDNITDYANPEVLRYFDHFGKKLRDGESIRFSKVDGGHAVLNKESRKRLLLASSRSNEYTASLSIRGLVTALDKDRRSFDIQLLNGVKIKGTYGEEHTKNLQEALFGLEDGQKVLIKATGIFSASDKLKAIHDVEEMNLLDEFDVPSRLEELSLLKSGWLDGNQGAPLNGEGLNWLSEAFENFYNSDDLPLPAAFPTPEGNVQFEWSFDNNEVSLEVDFKTQNADYFELDTASKKENSEQLNLTEEGDWKKLNELLLEIKGRTE
ncbi:MAG: hypothetical protein EA392_11810 [Cryomorphaceae bacterium]|nr:MAG: hypothetical protein EA392_11810 [Cryomorphaceae bacterium]